MEMVLKHSTEVLQSSKHVELPDDYTMDAAVITLDQLPNIVPFNNVTVDVQIIAVRLPTNVGNGKVKQDIIIADSTTTSKLTLWEEQVDSFIANRSYTLQNFIVREFNSVKYLQKSHDSDVIPIPDLPNVIAVTHDSDTEADNEIHNAQVIGVSQLDSYKSCIRCKACVEPLTSPLGRCSRINL